MKTRFLLAAAVLTMIGGVAFAGAQNSVPVQIDFDLMTALGDQVTARTAMNDVELIGCGSRTTDDGMGGMFAFGFCQATDSEANNILCFTFNDNLIDAIEALSAYSFISFNWQDDGAGGFECTSVRSSTQSFYVPNFTTKGSN